MERGWSQAFALTLLAIASSGCSGTSSGGAADTVAPGHSSAIPPVANQNSATSRTQAGRVIDGASPGSAKQHLYISGFGCNCFKIYSAKGKLLGSVDNGMQNSTGIATDPAGNIYVANRTSFGSISVFKPGANQPFENLTDDPSYAGSFASGECAAKDGTIYGVFFGGSGRSFSHVAVYKNGATSPTSVLTGPLNVEQMIACALDQAGNLFVTYYFQYNPSTQYASILEFPAAGGSPTDLGFLWGNIQGIATDSNSNVVVAGSPVKFGLEQAVLVIQPGKHKPLRVLLKRNDGRAYFGVAFDATRQFLYVVNPTLFRYFKIDYATGKVVWAKHAGWTYANEPYYVAVSPLAD